MCQQQIVHKIWNTKNTLVSITPLVTQTTLRELVIMSEFLVQNPEFLAFLKQIKRSEPVQLISHYQIHFLISAAV
jgi:hypothetical protein